MPDTSIDDKILSCCRITALRAGLALCQLDFAKAAELYTAAADRLDGRFPVFGDEWRDRATKAASDAIEALEWQKN